MAKAKRATISFSCAVGATEYIVHDGEMLPATHPVVKAHPELFEVDAGVEHRARPAVKRTGAKRKPVVRKPGAKRKR